MIRDDISKLLKNKAAPKVIEIGVEFGGFTDIYAEDILKNNGEIWLLDLWETEGNDFYFSKYKGQVEAGYEIVKQKYGNDNRFHIVKGSSFEKHNEFEDNFFDWIYLDADHSYEAVKKDIENWYSKLKVGGIISGHDFDVRPNQERAELFGVSKAVIEFFGSNFILTDEDFYKSWIHIK